MARSRLHPSGLEQHPLGPHHRLAGKLVRTSPTWTRLPFPCLPEAPADLSRPRGSMHLLAAQASSPRAEGSGWHEEGGGALPAPGPQAPHPHRLHLGRATWACPPGAAGVALTVGSGPPLSAPSSCRAGVVLTVCGLRTSSLSPILLQSRCRPDRPWAQDLLSQPRPLQSRQWLCPEVLLCPGVCSGVSPAPQ